MSGDASTGASVASGANNPPQSVRLRMVSLMSAGTKSLPLRISQPPPSALYIAIRFREISPWLAVSSSCRATRRSCESSSQGEISRNLIALYKALGGGWEIRKGKDFVPADIKETMRNRTDWGGLLAPEATDVPADAKPSGDRRPPDW